MHLHWEYRKRNTKRKQTKRKQNKKNKTLTIADSLNPALSKQIVHVSAYTIKISCLIIAKDIIHIKQAFTEYCPKYTWARIIWMQPTSVCVFGGWTRLRRSFSENNAADFVICDRSWCNALLGNKSFNPITKTRIFKYTEHFTTKKKKMKIFR